MGKVGDFLLWVPAVLFLTVLAVGVTTWFGFHLEANSRGFDLNDYKVQADGCFHNGNSTFCESDYGIMGLKTWMSEKDQKAFNSVFEKSALDVPQGICKEGVLSYSMNMTNNSPSLIVKCNN